MKIVSNNGFYIILVFMFFMACDTGTNPKDLIELSGEVYSFDSDKNIIPVDNALVSATNIYMQSITDQNGEYKFKFEPENNIVNVNISVTKPGYIPANTIFEAKKGQSAQVPSIELTHVWDDTSNIVGTISGDAAHIEILTPHDDHLYVSSSGLKETALLRFKVTDSEGIPVDNDHADTVHFRIMNGPQGGEYLYPLEMVTVNGYVYTTLNSSTISGPVQIECYIEKENMTIRSIPIQIAIYGGLPDDEYFSVAIERVNIAGQVYFGIIDKVTAFVGDKYSNPVAPGTVVYFSTDYGIVEGAVQTDEMGRATVNFMSAAPLPVDPATSSFAHIKAETYGDSLNNLKLTKNVSLLLSSVTDEIQVTPSSFDYNNSNTPELFSYNISDIYGNPLVASTVISVDATDGKILGDKSITLRDSRYPGPGSTDFSFSWSPGDSLQSPQVYISIKVTTPANGNGYQSRNIIGTKVPD